MRPQNVAEYGKLLAEAMKTSGNLSSAFAPWLEKIEQSGFKPLADNIKSNLDKVGLHTQPQQHQPVQPAGPNTGGGPAPPSGKKNFWQWFVYSLTKRYVDGKGRAHRMEYWSFIIMAMVIFVITMLIDGEMFTQTTGYTSDYMFQLIADGLYQPPVTSFVSLILRWPPHSRSPAAGCTISARMAGLRSPVSSRSLRWSSAFRPATRA